MTCSIRELARRCDISDTAINKMRAQGRLPADLFGVKESGRPYVIDPVRAAELVNQITAPEQINSQPNKKSTQRQPPPVAIDEGVTSQSMSATMPGQYQKARAARETFAAKIAEIDYKERIGLMIPRDQVKIALFGAGRIARDSLIQIPVRLSAQLAAENDQYTIQLKLTTEINQILQDLSDALSRSTADH